MLEDGWGRGGGHGALVVPDTHAPPEMTPEMEIAEETARIRAWRVNLTSISHELANQSATNLRVNLTEAETARHPETDSEENVFSSASEEARHPETDSSLSVFDLGSRASPKSRKSTEAETDTSVGQGGQGSPGYDSPLRCGGGGDAGAVAAGAGAPASSVSSASTSSPPPAAAGPHPHVPGNLHGWPGGALTSERVGEIESQVGEGVGVGGEGEPVERHRKGEEAGGGRGHGGGGGGKEEENTYVGNGEEDTEI